MKVEIQLKETSQNIIYPDAINTYQKGDLFCVYLSNGKVHKYPLRNIWRIIEDYNNKEDGK